MKKKGWRSWKKKKKEIEPQNPHNYGFEFAEEKDLSKFEYFPGNGIIPKKFRIAKNKKKKKVKFAKKEKGRGKGKGKGKGKG